MTTSLLLLLRQQHEQLVQLNELLLLEREAFAGRSPQQVNQVTEQKTAALDALQATDKQLSDNFSKDDFQSDDILTLKHQIEDELKTLKHNNEVNGKILQHKQVNNEQLRELIIGTRKDKTATTYDQLGKRTNTLKGRAIKA